MRIVDFIGQRNATGPGGFVVLPLKSAPVTAIGKVTGSYEYRPDSTDPSSRPSSHLAENGHPPHGGALARSGLSANSRRTRQHGLLSDS